MSILIEYGERRNGHHVVPTSLLRESGGVPLNIGPVKVSIEMVWHALLHNVIVNLAAHDAVRFLTHILTQQNPNSLDGRWDRRAIYLQLYRILNESIQRARVCLADYERYNSFASFPRPKSILPLDYSLIADHIFLQDVMRLFGGATLNQHIWMILKHVLVPGTVRTGHDIGCIIQATHGDHLGILDDYSGTMILHRVA